MIRLAVNKLEPGMVLAAPIPHPADSTRVLLNTDFRFDAQTLRRLKRWPVFSVWIRHPGFDFLDERLISDIPQCRMKLYESIKTSFTGIANRVTGAFKVEEYRSLVSQMILSMVTEKDHAVWAERILEGESELFGHSANVAYLALVIGMQLKRYIGSERHYIKGAQSEDLTNLGIGAMFHDFGKLGLKRRLQRTHVFDHRPTAESSGPDFDEYSRHNEAGYRVLQGRLDATAASIVLHHHQQFDGQGFPRLQSHFEEREAKEFKGHSIHVFSRVVAVANVLDGLVGVCQKKNRPTVAALAAIQKPPFAGAFDPVVLRAALRSIPPFPLGSCVTLSDGREAVVTDLNKKQSWRPKVRVVLTNPGRADQAGEEIDLGEESAPTIQSEGDRNVAPYIEFLDSLAKPTPVESSPPT